MPTPRPLRALSAAALAVIAALALTWATTTAQEPTAAATGTTLHPGANLVGWVGETAPVSQLFRDIPQLEAVWAWDAELDDWIVAGRNIPEGLGWLWQVSPGMGLYLILNGDQPFLWDRSTEPTRGMVELRTGWNLVAWSGASETLIDDATKGIGWSLREVRRHNAETQQWTAWTSPERTAKLIATAAADQSEESETPTIQRGEALWINVARAIHWLQPTDILLRLVFPGGASDALQARVREDLESVLAFYRTQYGIQAEPDFTVYIPKDADSLIQAWRDEGQEIDAAEVRGKWDYSSGWVADEGIVVKSTWWPDDSSASDIASGRYALNHEYFHVLQEQLSDGPIAAWLGVHVVDSWLVEGTATWSQVEHEVLDGEQTLQSWRKRMQSRLPSPTPSLRSSAARDTWPYTLGWLAIDQLAVDSGPDSWLEFWRRLAYTEIGPHQRWVSTPDWQTAFNETFGFSVSDFYAEADTSQHEYAVADTATANTDDGARRIHGRVTAASGSPVAGVLIRAADEVIVGLAETNADGVFAVRVPEDGDYVLLIEINEDCTRQYYYNNGQLIDLQDVVRGVVALPPTVVVAGSDLRDVNIRLPPNVCRLIQGRVIDDAGEPLSDVSIHACAVSIGGCSSWYRTARDGAFTVAVETGGEYRLSLTLGDSCIVYYRSGGEATLDWGQATAIEITNRNVDGIHVRVPSEFCRQRVVGSIAGIERFLDDGYVFANLSCYQGSTSCGAASRSLNRDGSFAVAAPAAGSYDLSYNLNGCILHYGATGLTSNWAEAMRFDAGDRDLRINHRRVPDTMCAYQISGTITGADGAPLANTSVYACEQVNGECPSNTSGTIGLTDAEGSFTITVPVDGSYRLSFSLDGCTIYFGQGRLIANSSDAWLTRVAGRDVLLSQRQVPAGGLCNQRISGRLVDASGAPLARVSISICQLAGDGCATWLWGNTDADGSFSVTVPVAGAYRLSANLDGCSVYYGAGGLTTRQGDVSPINVTEADSPNLQLHVPEGMCARRISGRFVDESGTPLAERPIQVLGSDGSWSGGSTDANGGFEVRVSNDSAYHFSIYLRDEPDCQYGLAGQRLLGSRDNPVRVTGTDVTGITLRLPGTIEELCN